MMQLTIFMLVIAAIPYPTNQFLFPRFRPHDLRGRSTYGRKETLCRSNSGDMSDIAVIGEKRTVDINKYRNIGIMAHIDAGTFDLIILF
jgi:hypothetical protein